LRQPYRQRQVNDLPRFSHFKPAGIPGRNLETITLTLDEFEAIRLADYEQMEHLQAAEQMHISRPTFTRLIEKARSKIARAIVEGQSIVIGGGNVHLKHTRHHCRDCGKTFRHAVVENRRGCRGCGSSNIDDMADNFIKP